MGGVWVWARQICADGEASTGRQRGVLESRREWEGGIQNRMRELEGEDAVRGKVVADLEDKLGGKTEEGGCCYGHSVRCGIDSVSFVVCCLCRNTVLQSDLPRLL